ncbi:inositol monophosphatase [Colwellia sp. 4_MG-2023]|uniref:inositol monophosphatase family protein n=1 Tax=unclassified Colwellia TaxID=196834 RepID=UPI0026E30A2A|nr:MULTISPECIES: inositol monophosphatase [unclassified Colwellia]MDO6507256.1 inositol monophosphatase [Colwellia sp. 5_MG-2023]MDO6555400.1 inositol monophosphatase [Colwellia sp. 4_MG-2023]
MLENKKLPLFENEFTKIGDAILSWRNDETIREVLEPKEFKTVADKKAHDSICNLIKETFGDVTILSEEEDIIEIERPNKYWLIDPIDGTASWYDGFDGFVTQAAYIENDVPIYGIVYAPAMNKLWTAVIGEGAFLNGKQLQPFQESNRLNLIDNYPEPKRIAKIITEQLVVDKYIECGSLGLKSCMVAAGIADLFVKDVVIRDWDIAPVIRIIEELNGFVTDLTGKKIVLTGSFVKENGLVVSRSLKLVQDIVNLERV